MQTMINCSARRPNVKMPQTDSQACLLDAQSNFPPQILSVSQHKNPDLSPSAYYSLLGFST